LAAKVPAPVVSVPKQSSTTELPTFEPLSTSEEKTFMVSADEGSWQSVTRKGELSESTMALRLKKKTEELEDLKSSYRYVKKSYDEVVAKSQNLERDLKAVVRSTEGKMVSMEQELAAVKAKNVSLTNVIGEFQASTKKAESLKASLDICDAKNKQLMTEKETLEMQRENMGVMLHEAEQETRQLSQQIQVYSNYPSQLEMAHSRIQSLESKLGTAESSYQNLMHSFQSWKKESEDMASHKDNDISILTAKLSALKSEQLDKERQFEQKTNQLNAIIESRSLSLSKVMADLEEKIAHNSQLQNQISSLLTNPGSPAKATGPLNNVCLHALESENEQLREANTLMGRYLENCISSKTF